MSSKIASSSKNLGSDLSSPPKKPKLAPIQSITVGELCCTLRLKVCAFERRSVNVKGKDPTTVLTIIGSDGEDFIQCVAWGKLSDKFSWIANNTSINVVFAFSNLKPAKANAQYNLGSVDHEVQFRDQSQLTKLLKCDELDGFDARKTFFSFMESEHSLHADDSFVATKLSAIRVGELSIELDVQLEAVYAIRTVSYNEIEARVLDVELKDGSATVKMSAWNIFADFLEFFLTGKQGERVFIRNVTAKKSGARIQLTFANQSRICICAAAKPKSMPTLLLHVVEENLRGKQQLQIRLRLLRTPMQFDYKDNLYATFATDGFHKVQLIFSHNLQLSNKQEIVVKLAQVECIGNAVLTFRLLNDSCFSRDKDFLIDSELELQDLEYPSATNVA